MVMISASSRAARSVLICERMASITAPRLFDYTNGSSLASDVTLASVPRSGMVQ